MNLEPAPESYRGERAKLGERVPFYFGRVLLAGAGQGRLALLLQKHNGLQVYGAGCDPDQAEALRPCFTHLIPEPLGATELPYEPEMFGAVIFRDFQGNAAEFIRVLQQVEPYLSATGMVYVLIPNHFYWKRLLHGVPAPGLAFEDVVKAQVAVGRQMYGFWLSEDTEFKNAPVDADGVIQAGGEVFRLTRSEDRDTLACVDLLFVLAPQGYSCVDHAEYFRTTGLPACGYEVLAQVPTQQLQDQDRLSLIELSKLRNLYEWAVQAERPSMLPFFARGAHHFRGVVARRPLETAAYETMACFWETIGDRSMAKGLRRSIEHAMGAPDPGAYRIEADTTPAPPVWVAGETPPNVLLVFPQRPHYGLDVVYDGLCRVLGKEHVTDFPFKATLHGATWKGLENYPCLLHWPGEPEPMEQVMARLRQGYYRFVVYGDSELELDTAMARTLMQALGNTPLFLFDANDEPTNVREAVREVIGNPPVAGYFKREMLACVDYGPNSFPMPFSYDEDRAVREFVPARAEAFFWAGHRASYIRKLYIDHLEQRTGLDCGQTFPPDEYARRMSSARIGLNLFGYGFDTVRYWELPAHGCMLFSERPPIRIPNAFEDGKTAVFFNDLREFDDKFDYYRAHPEEAEAIARAGHAHYWRYHTNSQRARDFLGYVEAVIRDITA